MTHAGVIYSACDSLLKVPSILHYHVEVISGEFDEINIRGSTSDTQLCFTKSQ